jgi:signal transduction histidine kinase
MAVWVLDIPDVGRSVGHFLVAVSTLILIAAWFVLPWDPRAHRRRRLLVLVFAGAIFAFCLATSFLWTLPLFALVVANGVFLFSSQRGIALAATTPPAVAVCTYVSTPEGPALGGALIYGGLMVPVAGFVIGVCRALVDAVRSRQETQNVLDDLERAHVTLRRQSAQIREFAITEERTRLAREMHDTLGHYLTAINLQLQNAERFEEKDPGRSRQKIREARESTLAALGEVRRAVRAMKPAALETGSGTAALRALARSFDGMSFEVAFDVAGHAQPLPEAVELALYRATQEGLTNAARHSGATHVDVRLMFDPVTVELVIRDDGQGACDEARERGYGLAALQDRIETLGGTLVARNDPAGGGFVLEATLPVATRQEQEVAER